MVSAYDRLYGGPTASGGLTTSVKNDSRFHLGGLAKLGAWKVGGGAIIRNNEGNATTPRSNLYYLGAAYKLTPAITIDGQLGQLDYRSSGNDTKQVLVRAIYDLSRRAAVYAAAGRIDNNGTAALTLTVGGSVGADRLDHRDQALILIARGRPVCGSPAILGTPWNKPFCTFKIDVRPPARQIVRRRGTSSTA